MCDWEFLFFFPLISDLISLLLKVDMSGHSSPADPPQLILNEERKQFVAAMIQPGMASLGEVTETRQVNETFHLPLPNLQLLKVFSVAMQLLGYIFLNLCG